MALLVVFVISPLLPAEEKESAKPRFGLTFPNIGVIWRFTDKIAFLPDVALGRNWGTLNSSLASDASQGLSNGDNHSYSVTVNAGLRFYLREWKGMNFYLTPRYSYGYTHTDNSNFSSGTTANSSVSQNRSHAVSGSWGLEYAITKRLSIFGDIGARYSRANSDISTQIAPPTSAYSSRQKINSVSTIGTWGLIVYLK